MKQKKYQLLAPLIQLINKLKFHAALLKSFDDFLNRYGLYLLCALSALIIFFVLKDFVLLKKHIFLRISAGIQLMELIPFYIVWRIISLKKGPQNDLLMSAWTKYYFSPFLLIKAGM